MEGCASPVIGIDIDAAGNQPPLRRV